MNPEQILEGQLRECYARAVYSHKVHEKCSDILQARLSCIRIIQIILSALTTGSFFATILGSGKEASIVGVILSTLLFGLNTYTKDYDLGALAQKHKQAANNIWMIREHYLSMLTDLKASSKDISALLQERDAVAKELHAVYVGSPTTTPRGYKRAQHALQTQGDMTFAESEIDSLLPATLRKS